MNHKKICIIGESGVGKTTLLNFLEYGKYEEKHIKTMGCEVRVLHLGGKRVHVRDCAGDSKHEGLGEGYCINADMVIVMFDPTQEKKKIEKDISKWTKTARKVTNAPIIYVASKIDKYDSAIHPKLSDNIIKISTLEKGLNCSALIGAIGLLKK